MEPREEEIAAFWADARIRANLNRISAIAGPGVVDSLPPPAWAFGATPAQADELLELVLAGTKTATAGAYDDDAADEEPLPQPGDLAIVLDGAGHPRALLATTDVRVVPFDEVDADHAWAEGEGDRSLSTWRRVHERFFTEHADHDLGFRPDMPVVLERFTRLVPTRDAPGRGD